MRPKKIFILLPDGVGLRNFAFTSFVETGKKLGWKVVFWNQTLFDITQLGFNEIELSGKPRSKTDLIKRAKIEAELDYFTKKFSDPVYQTYKFSPLSKSAKSIVKNTIVSTLVKTHNGRKGLKKLRNSLRTSERNGKFYAHCKLLLEREQPDFVFCTNQRPVNAIAPLTAAQDLNIPTATFIFSWDNLPKATMVVETDHYFVWSEYMQQELLKYYPSITQNQVHITGTPQFEPHHNLKLRRSRADFFKDYGLDPSTQYICFSGDDITTSPNDPYYLNDLAEAVKLLTNKMKLGIIFRRCPVDFSSRYDEILERFKDIIVPVAPKWVKVGNQWNTIFPTKEDMNLLINTIEHSEAVINVGSSMVFDFAIFNKPCLYINYDIENSPEKDWSTSKIYKFVHFRSMPNGDEVCWLNNKKEIALKLEQVLKDPDDKVEKARKWYSKINTQQPINASQRIWKKIDFIHDSVS